MNKILAGTLIVVASLFLFSVPHVMALDPCIADLNCDGSVDGGDVFPFLSEWNKRVLSNGCSCMETSCPCTFPCDQPAPVEKTGQTTSYATGDDGDLEKGVVWLNPRFTDNLDGTITDNLTGLIWLKNANCFDRRAWNNALSDSNGLASGSCGLTDGSIAGDWRLPNKRELISITHDGYYGPAVPDTAGTGQWSQGDPFNNVQSYYYWSSTTNAHNSSNAWIVLMSIGYVDPYSVKTNVYYVWPVRGGQ